MEAVASRRLCAIELLHKHRPNPVVIISTLDVLGEDLKNLRLSLEDIESGSEEDEETTQKYNTAMAVIKRVGSLKLGK
jgi:hypothetical protein